MHLFRLYLVSYQLQKTMLLCIFSVEIGQDQLVKICTFILSGPSLLIFPFHWKLMSLLVNTTFPQRLSISNSILSIFCASMSLKKSLLLSPFGVNTLGISYFISGATMVI